MAVSTYVYGNILLKAFNKEIDWTADDVKIMLCTSSYTPDQDTHDYKDDVTNEVTGDGYTTGGMSLATPTATYTAGTNTVKFDANDAVWTASTITARYAVIYDGTPGSDATRPVIAYIDFGENKSSSSGSFTIQFNADGIFKAVVA